MPVRAPRRILVIMTASRTIPLDIPSRVVRGLVRVGRAVEALWSSFVRDWTLGVWLVNWNGDIQGVLRHDGAQWRLEWLEGVDPRLASYAVAHPDASIDDITDALVRHLSVATPPAAAPAESLRIEPVLAF